MPANAPAYDSLTLSTEDLYDKVDAWYARGLFSFEALSLGNDLHKNAVIINVSVELRLWR